MKKIIIISLLCYAALTVKAQGTLQFNQVKLISSVQTVPSGKVWKISNILPNTRLTSVAGTTSSVGSASTQQQIVVDGVQIYVATSDSRGFFYSSGQTGAFTNNSANILSSPIWLPAGTTLAAGSGVEKVSILEFNIIP